MFKPTKSNAEVPTLDHEKKEDILEGRKKLGQCKMQIILMQ